MRTLVILASLILASCGSNKSGSDDPGQPAQEQQNQQGPTNFAMAVPTDADLPTCDQPSKYRLVYVTASAQFKSCDGAAWAVIDIKGKDGAAGLPGAAGKDGTDNRIVKSIGCSGPLENTTLWFTYDVALMSSGDVFASGAIRDNSLQIGATSFYSSQQVGAIAAPVIFTNDYETAHIGYYWRISLNRVDLVTTIKYSKSSETTWTMTPDKCTVNDYN